MCCVTHVAVAYTLQSIMAYARLHTAGSREMQMEERGPAVHTALTRSAARGAPLAPAVRGERRHTLDAPDSTVGIPIEPGPAVPAKREFAPWVHATRREGSAPAQATSHGVRCRNASRRGRGTHDSQDRRAAGVRVARRTESSGVWRSQSRRGPPREASVKLMWPT